MCILCNYGNRNIHASQGLNYISSSSLTNLVSESSDAANNSLTSYSISSGETFSGSIDIFGDRDWVGITLQQGSTYIFNLTGRTSGNGTLSDPYLRLYNSEGSLLSQNDDGGSGLESRITFTASSSGIYYLSAGAYEGYGRYIGSYRLSSTVIREFGDFSPNTNLSSLNTWEAIDSNNDFIAGLMWDSGAQWGSVDPITTTTELNYFIYDNSTTLGNYNAGNLFAEERAAYIASMNAYSSVANISFTESQNASDSHILWASLNNSDSGGSDTFGWASPPNVSGSHLDSFGDPVGLTTQNYTQYSSNGQLDNSNILSPGSFYYITSIHELGHSLGLSHPHDSNVFPGVSNSGDGGDNGLNATPYTVMTYNDIGANEFVPDSFAYSGFLETLGAFDIAAIQYLYGPNSNASTGDDTYSLDTSTLNGWNCIWDNGGQDVITAVGQTDSVSINLKNATLENSLGGGGFISRLGTQNIGYLIAYNSTGNCVIEMLSED